MRLGEIRAKVGKAETRVSPRFAFVDSWGNVLHVRTTPQRIGQENIRAASIGKLTGIAQDERRTLTGSR